MATDKSKTYVFQVSLAEEEDGRWSAWIDALPGCSVWAHSRDEAFAALQDAAALYVEDMIAEGEALPAEGVLVVDAPAVAVAPRAA